MESCLAGDASTALKAVGSREAQGFDSAIFPPLYGCLAESGLWRQSRKLKYGNVPWVRIPQHPH